MRVQCRYIGFFNSGERMPFAQTCTIELGSDDGDTIADAAQRRLDDTGRRHNQTYADIVVWLRDAATGAPLFHADEPLPERRTL